MLDRYERLIEATRLAGREHEAVRLFWQEMDFKRLFDEGEYQRIYRILASFSSTGQPQDLGPAIELRARTALVASLALAAQRLGRLDEALALRQLDDAWTQPLGDLPQISLGLQTTSELTRTMGRLVEARAFADAAVDAVGGLRHQTGFAFLVRAMSATCSVIRPPRARISQPERRWRERRRRSPFRRVAIMWISANSGLPVRC